MNRQPIRHSIVIVTYTSLLTLVTWLSMSVLIPGLIPAARAVTHTIKVSRLTPSSTSRRGGSGGAPYSLTCREGSVLVGVAARTGSLVDQVRGICRRITNTGAWTGGEILTGIAGGRGGSARARRCPSGFALSGFSGRASSVINQLRLECTRLGSNGTLNTAQRTRLSSFGGTGGTSFGTTRCSRPARAIAGRAGTFVDSFELACETNSPEMTTAQVDRALSGATNILRNDGGAADVFCDVRMQRTGGVNIEPSNGMWNVSSSSEMNRACGLPGFAVVTDRITYCSGIGSNIVGCARPGCMVVVPIGGTANTSQLWAHEFGHTRALPHRNGTGNVMNDTINQGARINSSECGNYKNPVLSFFFGFLPAEESSSANMSVEEFVAQTFIHGVPYEQGSAYGPQAVPKLQAILNDPAQESNWSNAVTVLAMIDDPGGVDTVINFIDKVNPKDRRSPGARARANALLSLGYSAANGRNAKSMKYLDESLDKDVWKKRRITGARGLREAPDEDGTEPLEDGLDEELTEYAVMGLALSGRAEARQRLEKFAKAPGRSQRHKQLVSMAVEEHDKIKRQGIRKYDFDRRARAADRASAERRSRQNKGQKGQEPEKAKRSNP